MKHINKVTVGDSDQLAHVTKLAYKFAKEYCGSNPDLSSVDRVLKLCVETGVVLFTSQGFIAGIPINQFTNTGLTMVEFAWYSEDRSGLKLLREFEKASEDLGCTEIHMTTLKQNPLADKILGRLQYNAFQTTWIKQIGET